jgi:hypothetical protein
LLLFCGIKCFDVIFLHSFSLEYSLSSWSAIPTKKQVTDSVPHFCASRICFLYKYDLCTIAAIDAMVKSYSHAFTLLKMNSYELLKVTTNITLNQYQRETTTYGIKTIMIRPLRCCSLLFHQLFITIFNFFFHISDVFWLRLNLEIHLISQSHELSYNYIQVYLLLLPKGTNLSIFRILLIYILYFLLQKIFISSY